MPHEESSSDWMRIKKFFAHVAMDTGLRLGWDFVQLHTADQSLIVQFSNILHDGDSEAYKKALCYSKIFHSEGWYCSDEQGSHFVSFGNGANYVPHGYPSVAGTLYIVVGEARSISAPSKNSARKKARRLTEPGDLLKQDRYQSGLLLIGLHDGTIAVADEHPFYFETLALLNGQIERYRRAVDYALPGTVVPQSKGALAAQEFQYHKDFVPIIAEHLVSQVICATEGTAIRERPILCIIDSTQK